MREEVHRRMDLGFLRWSLDSLLGVSKILTHLGFPLEKQRGLSN